MRTLHRPRPQDQSWLSPRRKALALIASCALVIPLTPSPAGASGGSFFDDDGSIFEDDIDWLAAAGVTKGCNPPTNDRFCPNDDVTRGQMAAFLVRALNYTDNGGGNHFTDDDGSIFEDDIDKLATAGVTKGCNPPTNDRFCPNDNVTRGQMAAFLHRALDDAGLVIGGRVFEDLDGDGLMDAGDVPLSGIMVWTWAEDESVWTETNDEGRYYLPRLADDVWVAGELYFPRVPTSSWLVALTASDRGVGVDFGQSSCGGLTQARITNPTPGEDDRFGNAVAVSDGRIAVATMDGDVYVYSKSGDEWQPTLVQTAGDGTFAPWQSEGQYLAFEADTLVVGTALADQAGQDSGEVRVYTEEGSDWVLTQLIPGTVDWGDELGYSVDIDEGRIIAGAPADSSLLNYAGAAYVFDRNNGSWVNERLDPPTPNYWDWFGASVAIDGDTAVVAESVSFEGSSAGAVHVFTLADDVWTGTEIASAPDDNLGWSVAADGGLIAAGAPQIGADASGYVDLFLADGSHYDRILLGTGQFRAELGSDVAIQVYDDPSDYVLVAGAPRQDPFGIALLRGPRLVPSPSYCSPWNGDWYEQFGAAVDIDDGVVVIGAPLSNVGATRAGVVYIYEIP